MTIGFIKNKVSHCRIIIYSETQIFIIIFAWQIWYNIYRVKEILMSDWLLETILKGIEELENEKKIPGWFSVASISNVPYIKYPGLTEKECLEIQEQTRNVLRYSRNINKYGEVAIVYEIGDDSKEKYKIAFGNENRIKIMDNQQIKSLVSSNNIKNNLVAVCIHNHPNSSGFSVSDLFMFSQNQCIKIMAIVNKEGQVSFLMREKATDLCNIVLNNIVENVSYFIGKLDTFKSKQIDFSLSDIIEKGTLKKIVDSSLNDFKILGILYKSYMDASYNKIVSTEENVKDFSVPHNVEEIDSTLQEQANDEYLENGEDGYEWEYR